MKVSTTLSIDHEIKDRAKKKALKEGLSLSGYIEYLITKDHEK